MKIEEVKLICGDKELMFDKRGLKLFVKYNWYLGERYLFRSAGFGNNPIAFHREFACILGIPTTLTIDHINRNALDNRAVNLRCANSSVQNQNTQRRKSNNATSIYRGVSLQDGRWLARIAKEGKKLNLGSFQTELEAAAAYDKKALEIYGSNAFTNFQY